MLLRHLGFITLTILLVSCNADKPEPIEKRVRTSPLKFCRASNDVDADYQMFNCASVGDYSLTVGIQRKRYILINLKQGGLIIGSEMERLNDLLGQTPLIDFNDTIQWHMWNKMPRYMVLPLVLPKSDSNTQYLSAHLVHESRICPLAVVKTEAIHVAQDQMKLLLNEKFDSLQSCPNEIFLFDQ